MGLRQSLFNEGHTLFTDNWYTSIDLAGKLLENETHLVGTVQKNRKNLPKDVINAKFRTGEYKAHENENRITVMKWKDKRDVLLLSTKHSSKFVKTTNNRGQEKYKPKIVVDYNKSKGAIDLSDQMTAYSSPLRKSLKWYKKLGIELILNTVMVNALILYKVSTNKNLSVVDFRKAIINYLCNKNNEKNTTSISKKRRDKHELKIRDGTARTTRKCCKGCYSDNVKEYGRIYAKNKTIRVKTYCSVHPTRPHYCIRCFNKIHKF